MPWQRWFSVMAGLISLGVVAHEVFFPVTMESLETMPVWLSLAILALAVAVFSETHLAHKRIRHAHKRLDDIHGRPKS